MGSSDVLSCEQKVDSKKKSLKVTEKVIKSKEELQISSDEKPASEKPIKYVYLKEELLNLRSAPASRKKPACLLKEYFTKDNVWDPEAWHKSDTSRSASPAVVDEGKSNDGKSNVMDDNIELAPHRKSFRQGCHVHATQDRSEKPSSRAIFEKKTRLTGRASGQRKTIETNYREQADDRFRKSDRGNHYDDRRQDKSHHADHHETRRDRSDSDYRKDRHLDRHQDERAPVKDSKKRDSMNGRHGKESAKESLPEWATDGPTSQHDIMEFTGFQDIEDEKKAYAKRKNMKKSTGQSVVHDWNAVKTAGAKKSKSSNDDSRKETRKSGKCTPSEKMFDFDDFFQEVDYYPPHMFREDIVNSDGVKSRFTQWFQDQSRNNSRNSNNSSSTPGSASLLPDEIFTGQPSSPSYFTPIQPAVDSPMAAINAQVQTSNILSIIHKHADDSITQQQKKEVRGRMTLNDLEHNEATVKTAKPHNQNAFEMFVQSMKASGQLPEKPAPVVTGLPDHLLPTPPTATSPTFEKLKRVLSRSPSPVQIVKAVSTVANIIASNPSINSDLAYMQQQLSFSKENETVNETVLQDSNCQQRKASTSFMPTSVLKKIHNEKLRDSSANDSMIAYANTSTHQDITNNSEQPDDTLNDDFNQLLLTPERAIFPKTSVLSEKENAISFHSLPTTPRNYLKVVPHSISAPGTPEQSNSAIEPPPVQRFPNTSLSSDTVFLPTPKVKPSSLLLAPSAFQTKSKSVGVIGSRGTTRKDLPAHGPGRMFEQQESQRGVADPRLAPGNRSYSSGNPFASGNLVRPMMQSTPSGGAHSQQQQLLHDQRMAQIHQAQLHQQQKLKQIAQQANYQKQGQMTQSKMFPTAVGVRPLLPDPSTQPTDHQQYQQKQQEQIQAFRQQQKNQVPGHFPSTQLFNPGQRNPYSNLHPPRPPNQQQVPGVNLAAQALIQQQLLQQAARANFLAQAHFLQQQPQVMQAAIMARAALARGQAHAAMMLNPRNIQAMAEQMGIRKPPSAAPMMQPTNMSGLSPISTDTDNGHASNNDFLAKWFGKDVWQQMPSKSPEVPVANVMSVEELEKRQQAL